MINLVEKLVLWMDTMKTKYDVGARVCVGVGWKME